MRALQRGLRAVRCGQRARAVQCMQTVRLLLLVRAVQCTQRSRALRCMQTVRLLLLVRGVQCMQALQCVQIA